VWDVQKGRLLVTLGGHTRWVTSLAWSQDGTRLFTGSADGTLRVWDSRWNHNYEAEFLLVKLSASCFLAEECVEAVRTQSGISSDLQRDAIQLAKLHGNARSSFLVDAALKVGLVPGQFPQAYQQALRRIAAGAEITPWNSNAQVTLALLQYRTGNFKAALLSSQRAMDLQKIKGPVGHAIRAMAYYRLHDLVRARDEVKLAHPEANQPREDNELALEAEAQALITPRKPGEDSRR
jgi:hypothetical protein